MTRVLASPSAELTERLRREVGPEQRLTGLKMSVMGGSNPIGLFSLAAVASFLKIGTYEEATRPNNQETIGYIDLGALEKWVREVLEDAELADAIAEETGAGEPFGVVAPRVRELLRMRALQVAPAPDDDAQEEPASE